MRKSKIYTHPVLKAVASVCYRYGGTLEEIDNHPQYDKIIANSDKLTHGHIKDLAAANKQYNSLAFKEGKDAKLPDYLTFMINNYPAILADFKKHDFMVIPTVEFKESYRSLKVGEFKSVTCIELGNIPSTFNGNKFSWCVFLVCKNSALLNAPVLDFDYSTLNLNKEKSDISHFRVAAKDIIPEYNEIAVPLLLYLFRYYHAVNTTNECPIPFQLPEGLEFLNSVGEKHVHKNELMTNFLQRMLYFLANHNILV